MPYIKPEIIDKVWETVDTLQILQKFVELKKKGANWMGLSPFNEEKSGSFSYSPAKGIWKDFSSGKGGSSAVSFLRAKEGLEYIQAIEWLADFYNIPIEYDDSEWAKEEQKKSERRGELRPLLAAVIKKYQEAFKKLPKKHPAKIEVYEKRKYTDDIVEKYSIGYAPGNKFIYDIVVEHGRKTDAIEIGLISEKGDKWFDRVIYPLINKKGTSLQPVGLAGRSLSLDKSYAKWINSSESSLYDKSKFWYGLAMAREAIVKHDEAWIVEGYNDVIAWQEHGIPQTIAPCGTAIAIAQMKALKKLCSKVVLNFDPDGPGKKAMLRYIPQFLQLGFRVELVFNKEGLDPDEFVRHFKLSKKKYNLSNLSKNRKYRHDGFQFLMKENFKGKSDIQLIDEARKLALIIKKIDDESMSIIYKMSLKTTSKISQKQINDWLKEETSEEKSHALSFRTYHESDPDFYTLPKSVKTPIDTLRPFIEKYEMFMAADQIWVKGNDGPPYSFRSVSNFSIEIIQHMQDEKYPMKLVRVKNVHGHERIFDMQSSDMNATQAFENAVTAHGNFRWKGTRKDHELLKTYLFDSMGVGRKIDVLGWQPEGFWVWNNEITVPGNDPVPLDDNGVFELDSVSYYIPSANSIYRGNMYKYEAQKKVISLTPPVTFQNYADQVMKVHRNHGMMGILFSIASIFQDIVVSELNSFPMLFLFGPASSGKDLLADCCQSFFGTPQTAINLEGGVSTIKAQVREFAQFSNTISQLSEYKTGDPKLDGVLKGLWDRRGYKRGNIDSYVGTESIPILSSVIMTGNYEPDQEALITRFIYCLMDKTTFDDTAVKEYEKLSDMTKKGISGFTNMFLQHREAVKNNFKAKFRAFKATLTERHDKTNSRMIANLAVLGTFYQMFQNVPEFQFPFSHNLMLEHFGKVLEMQMNKMSSASIINRWWDCFMASMRGNLQDQIRHGRDFKIEGDMLYFQFTACYSRIQRQWFSQYKDTAPAKGAMMEALKKEPSWVAQHKAIRYSPGREGKATSAYQINLMAMNIADDIKYAADFQQHEKSLFPPATPENEINFLDHKGETHEDLPF